MTWDYHLYNYILSRCGKITLVIVVGGAVVAVASSSRSTMMYTPQVDLPSSSDLRPISSSVIDDDRLSYVSLI